MAHVVLQGFAFLDSQCGLDWSAKEKDARGLKQIDRPKTNCRSERKAVSMHSSWNYNSIES